MVPGERLPAVAQCPWTTWTNAAPGFFVLAAFGLPAVAAASLDISLTALKRRDRTVAALVYIADGTWQPPSLARVRSRLEVSSL